MDVAEDGIYGSHRTPAKAFGRGPVVGHEPDHVGGAVLRLRGNGNPVPGEPLAKIGGLEQGQVGECGPADREDFSTEVYDLAGLKQYEFNEIIDMEQVAHLLALAAEADIGEGALQQMRDKPIGKYALILFPKLPRPGDHATAVDDGRQAVLVTVFL